jgi:hypothetical protein
MSTSTLHFRVLLHAVNLRHGTECFTSPLKEGMLRIFSPFMHLTGTIICHLVSSHTIHPLCYVTHIFTHLPCTISSHLVSSHTIHPLCYVTHIFTHLSCTILCHLVSSHTPYVRVKPPTSSHILPASHQAAPLPSGPCLHCIKPPTSSHTFPAPCYATWCHHVLYMHHVMLPTSSHILPASHPLSSGPCLHSPAHCSVHIVYL